MLSSASQLSEVTSKGTASQAGPSSVAAMTNSSSWNSATTPPCSRLPIDDEAQTPLAPRARIFLSWVVGRSRTARGRDTPLTPPPDLRSLAARSGRHSDWAHVGPVGLDRNKKEERRRGAAARGGGVRSGYLY